VSPRSEEFFESARERLLGAEDSLEGNHLELAISAAYYAMLYAARAALSEDDESARTHRGTWKLFRERYVVTDVFDDGLFRLAQNAQTAREQGDYEAVKQSREKAQEIVAAAGEFLAAVETMLVG
jgi:uncharacterized protein (UPF0332 family)